ncbi:MAG: hypothetical protein IJ711_04195 [Lachnospiraceae bacterium]|nr:hypothetical protein [Lachnospiraceae bacterium]
MKKALGKILGFFLILGIILTQLNRIFSFKYEDGIRQMEQFYRQEKGTVDVLVLGSSHAFVDIDPAVLYERQGIAAYDLCASMQSTWHTYYDLKEALKYQKPKLVVMDVFRIVENFNYSKESKLIKSVYGMRPSRDKLEAIRAGLSEEEQASAYLYFLEFPSYHSRYTDLTEEDFTDHPSKLAGYKGYYPATEVTELKRPRVEDISERYPIEEKTKEYFIRILKLAKENNIPVLLINAPYRMSEDDKRVYNSLEDLLEELSAEYPTVYVDFNRMYDELGLDFEVDFADEDHLNRTGVQKLDSYLADYLAAHYELPDRREDARFASYLCNQF